MTKYYERNISMSRHGTATPAQKCAPRGVRGRSLQKQLRINRREAVTLTDPVP